MRPEKYIPIKKTNTVPPVGSQRKYKYPLDELLEPGDYFEVERPAIEAQQPRPDKYRTLCNVRSHVTYYLKTEEGRGKVFACRHSVDDKGNSIVICIRVS